MIHLEGVSKVFGTGWPWRKITALSGIDLGVEPGEVIGYLGPNGAGKTTTLKLLVGLLRPTAGRILVGGLSPMLPAARELVGFLPENPYFYEYLTGREFLTLCARLGQRAPEAGRRVGPLLERVGLERAADRPLRKYSKGMLQRAGLAQALVNDPPLLILDEPMSGLDPIGRREVRDLILELKAAGKTILFSSHILADVELICDRVAFLHRGRLLKVSSVEELSDREGEVEVTVRGVDRSALAGLEPRLAGVVPARDGLVLRLADAGMVAEAVASVAAAGGTVFSVTPRRRSLEDYFMDLIGRDVG
jgi:ABC-2 type transport system ATP-binding protein